MEVGENWSARKTNNGIFNIRVFNYPEDYPAAINLWEKSGPGVQLGRSDSP